MNLALKRGITNWERSGQGDGGYTDEYDDISRDNDIDSAGNDNDVFEFGDLRGRPQRA